MDLNEPWSEASLPLLLWQALYCLGVFQKNNNLQSFLNLPEMLLPIRVCIFRIHFYLNIVPHPPLSAQYSGLIEWNLCYSSAMRWFE